MPLVMQVMLPLGIGNWYDLYDDISHDRTRCPQLFLYSRADEIVPAADVAELVEARETAGPAGEAGGVGRVSARPALHHAPRRLHRHLPPLRSRLSGRAVVTL